MGKITKLILKDLILNRFFLLGWILAFMVFNLMMYALYPGEEGIQAFLGLLDQEIFQAILGGIDSEAAPVLIWMSFALPTMGLVAFIAASLYGNRTILLDMDLGTHETFFPLPVRRTLNLSISFLNGQIISAIFNLALILPWFFPIEGNHVEFSILMNLFIFNQLFFTMGYLLGIFLGILGGNLGRMQQFSLLLILVFYSVQILFRVNDSLQDLNDMNFLNWYDLNSVLFENKLPTKEVQYIVITSIIFVLLDVWLYSKKEFEKDIAMVNLKKPISIIFKALSPLTSFLNFLNPRTYFQSLDSRVSKLEKKVNGEKKSKSATSGIFVFWAKALKKRLPYTADFLFSEARTLTIMFWVLVMFYPLQFFAYPGDEEAQAFIIGFSGGFVNLITYGYDLSNAPYVWWIVTQAIGIHWFFMFPLALYWGKKIVSYDKDRKIGDLVGSLPVHPSIIVTQRIFAIIIELHILYVQMALYTFLSDQTFGYSSETAYHLAAIYGFVPLYLLLTLLLAVPIYLSQSKGVIWSRLLGIAILMWFVIPFMTQTSIDPLEAGLIGLYNPVKVILNQDIAEAVRQIAIFSTGALLVGAFLIKFSEKLPFIETY